jgi:hypothetical protein
MVRRNLNNQVICILAAHVVWSAFAAILGDKFLLVAE